MARLTAPLLADELALELDGGELSADAWERRSQLLQRLPKELRRIPALPTVVTEVLALSSSPNGDARRMEQVLSRDTVIAGRTLKLANSSFYRRARPVGRVSQAVVALGHRTVRSVVLAASVEKLLTGSGDELGYAPGGLWVHGLAVGLASQALAREVLPQLDDEVTLLAGLLHDAGRLPMMSVLRKHARQWLDGRTSGRSSDQVEREVLGIHHGELGGHVAARWHLPDVYGAVATHHHRPPVEHEHAGFIAVVHVADVWAVRSALGQLQPWDSEVHPDALAVLGRSEAELLGILDERKADIERLCQELVQ